MTCMAPHVEAPNLMGFDDVEGHCFVRQQPKTDDEIYRAIRAVGSSEVQCLRYGGNDPDILNVELGEPATDRFLVHHSPIWEAGSVAVSLMIDDWLRSDSRRSDFRWFTSDQWKRAGDQWQERPY